MPPDEAVTKHERPDDPHRVTGNVLNDVVEKRVLRAAHRGGPEDAPWRCDGLGEEIQDVSTLHCASIMEHDGFRVIAVGQSSGVAEFEQGDLFRQKCCGVQGHDDETRGTAGGPAGGN